jgi:hypothetical protein
MSIIKKLRKKLPNAQLGIQIFEDDSMLVLIYESEFPITVDAMKGRVYTEGELLSNQTLTPDMLQEIHQAMVLLERNIEEVREWL